MKDEKDLFNGQFIILKYKRVSDLEFTRELQCSSVVSY